MKLKFGTGGLRAIMDIGDEYMNVSTVQKATLGVVYYAKTFSKTPRIAIAYDTRNHSESFARQTARVLALKGCIAYIYPQAVPTPMLSFAVRKLGCEMGICITASHNPKDYNGYKVYGSDGCQITNETAELIQKEIERVDQEELRDWRSYEDLQREGKIICIDQSMTKDFLDTVRKLRTRKELTANLKVVYTPLNGTGLIPVTEILKSIGIEEITLVEPQAKPDGNFPTCPYPNPEEPEAMQMGVELCRKIDADILIATDPDCDRIGVAAKCGNDYQLLNGNQMGVLLLDYILKYRTETNTMPERPIVLKTIVTTGMAEKIAEKYGAEVIDTLTGFKYIGEQIGRLEKTGEIGRFVFGFEESCGYLIGTYARDKDAVGAAMLVCEMADYYKDHGKTLWDVLEELYQVYGYYVTELKTRRYEREEAEAYMKQLRNSLEKKETVKIENLTVEKYLDYRHGIQGLPKSNVLKLWTSEGDTIVIRPSGTEPKIKIYKETVC